MKLNKKIILASILMLIVLLYTSTVHAAIQSSGGTTANNRADNWITAVRQMESIGGGFGLSETINSDLTSSSGSNNIDVHMEKNTEYGAMAILSASSYGNPSKIADGQTTTGNETGVVIRFGYNSSIYNYEAMASTFYNTDVLGKLNRKYRDDYSNKISKVGDATDETSGWHNSNKNNLKSYSTTNNNILFRSYMEKKRSFSV